MPPVRFTVTFDAVAPTALADWWAETLGWKRRFANDELAILAPDGAEAANPTDDEHMIFMKVPEGKAVKNRCHLDLHPDGDTDAYLQRLVDRGATRIGDHGAPWPVKWAVLQDPEGNEFCVILGRVDG